MERYFGTYQTFRTVSKKDAAVLMGSNTLVGDRYRINLTMDEGVHRAWLINKFNETIGYFDDGFSRTEPFCSGRSGTRGNPLLCRLHGNT